MGSWSINSFARAWDKTQSRSSLKILSRRFYVRDTQTVAQELLGKIILVRYRIQNRTEVTAARIVETEAYLEGDPAAHSFRGETPRSSIMFGPPGVAYVYFIYGMYEMLNFVTEPEGRPGAVLIRAVEPLYGEELMHERRTRRARGVGAKRLSRHQLTNGPGRLCHALGIQMSHKGERLMGPKLFVADDGWRPEKIYASPRVGIREGIEHFWRFFIADNPFVSKAPQNSEAREIGCRKGKSRPNFCRKSKMPST